MPSSHHLLTAGDHSALHSVVPVTLSKLFLVLAGVCVSLPILYAATLTTFKANPMLSKSDVSLGKNNLNWVTCVLYCSTVRLPCDHQFQMAASISFVGLGDSNCSKLILIFPIALRPDAPITLILVLNYSPQVTCWSFPGTLLLSLPAPVATP